jgi:MIP family channel proteins
MSTTPSLGRRFVAEIVGTFIFVFVGAGSAVATQLLVTSGGVPGGVGLLIGALANGLGLAIGISTTLSVSGGALNPAVTIGLWIGKKLPGRDVVPYIIAEVVGATLAGLLLLGVTPYALGKDVEWGSPQLSSMITVSQGLVFELAMTFFLVMAVYGTIIDERAPRIAGLGVGFIVIADVLAGGLFTGAAMNPARAIGPMLAGQFFPSYWYIYWVGPIIGGALAGFVYHFAFESKKK